MAPAVRSRKAEGSISDRPAKRSKRSDASQDLKSALLANGAPNSLKAVPKSKGNATSSHQINDAKAVISNSTGHGKLPTPAFKQKDAILISSDESSDASEGEEEGDDEEEEEEDTQLAANGNSPERIIEDSDKENLDETKAAEQEPTYGELMMRMGYENEVVDVEEHFPAHVEPETNNHVVVTGATLTTVLAQALRTNDRQLLESCLIMPDLESVRLTISRLDSPMAVDLLQAIAERLYSRPGRANNLMVWLQWTLVAHGGYLASQPGISKALGPLYRAVKERAFALQSLLALKGKLDMLAAQMELRRMVGATNRDDDEDGVTVYVEGQEDAINDVASEDSGEIPIYDSEAEPAPKAKASETVDPGLSDSESSEDDDDEDSESDSEGSEGGLTDIGVDSESEEEEDEDENEEASLTRTRKRRR